MGSEAVIIMEAATVGDPSKFLSAQALENILSIVQFGSSLHTDKPGDIDLCVVVKEGCFFNLLSDRPFVQKPSNIDISLLREEELVGSDSFRFGSHGAHLLVSLREGRAIYGKNVFLELPTPTEVAAKVKSTLENNKK